MLMVIKIIVDLYDILQVYIIKIVFRFHFPGPLASLLTEKIGFRETAILGSLIGSAGLALSSFATTVFQMTLTFGLVTGLVP